MGCKCGSQVILCNLPVRFDTYKGCSHGCKYCFAQKKQNIAKIQRDETVEALRSFIEGKRGRETAWCDWNIPIHWGGMSDPFQPIEKNIRASYDCLKLLAETKYPFVVSTKGKLVADPEYLDLLAQCNCVVQVSMVCSKYDPLEPGTPPYEERLKIVETLAARVQRVIVRVQPYMPEVFRDVMANIPRLAAAGVYGVVVEGMKPTAQIPQEDVDAIAALLDRANIDAERHLTSDTISENAPVKAWREAYRLFKTKKGARCSIENLLKRVLKGKPVGHITPAVDIYNTVSLTYALPVGGEDLHAIEGDLRLKVTDGGDAFLPLGEEADDPTLPGELAYIDDAGAVCRCWNWRDGVRTALSDNSADAFLAIECVESERMGDCQAAIDRLAELLERYLGATVVIKTLVTCDNPCVEL